MKHRTAALSLIAALAAVSQAHAAGPYKFYGITPCRLIDTSDTTGQHPPPTAGPALQHGEVRNLPIWGPSARSCGIPAHARAVAVNVVVKSPTSGGHLILFPAAEPLPLASTINYNAGEPALANGASVRLTDLETVQLSVANFMAGPGNTVHFILDVTGYFE